MMTTQLLCTTGLGIQTIRKDYNRRSEVKIKGPNNYHFCTIRFNNVPLTYDTHYLNWENFNCCEAWAWDEDYLNHAVQNDRKLYAGISRRALPELIPELDALGLCYGYEPEFGALAYICKPGCVADYINLDEVLTAYNALGFQFSERELAYLNELVHAPLQSFSTIENRFDLDYGNPEGIQFVFVGLMLGYPIESTAHILEQWGY